MVTRKRIRTHFTVAGSGGQVGSPTIGNVEWGPNFGEAQELTVGATASNPSNALSGIIDEGTTVTLALLAPAYQDTVGVTVSQAQELVVYINSVGVNVSFAEAAILLIDAAGATAALSALAAAYTTGTAGVTATLAKFAIDDLDWADAEPTTTGFTTNPTNAIDKSTSTFAQATATATGVAGITNVTLNVDLILTFPDFTTPLTTYTIDSVRWEYRYATDTGGTQITAGVVNCDWQYSINDGSTWNVQTHLGTAGNTDSGDTSVDMTATINTWTKINQFASRMNGSIQSGTGTGKFQNISVYYSRLHITAHKDNP